MLTVWMEGLTGVTFNNNTNKKQEANISMYLSTDTNSSLGLWPRELNIWKKFRRL